MTGLPVTVIGRTTMTAAEIEGPVGVRLHVVPDGPISALLLVQGGDVRVSLNAGLLFDDRGGMLLPEGSAFLAPSAADLRVVAAERGASVEVVFLAPAGGAG